MSLKGSQTGGQRQGNVGDAYADAQRRQGGQQGAGQQEARQESAQQQNAGGRPFGWDAMASFIPLPASASQQSETLSRIRGIMENEIKNAPDANYDVTFVGIDKDEPGVNLGVSVLICCVQAKNARNLGVGYHTLLLEASASGFRPQQVQIGQGRTVEVPTMTGDAYDSIMITEIRNRLERQFPSTPLFSSDSRVLSKDFNLNDDGLIKRLRGEVVLAATVALAVNRPGFKDFSLGMIPGQDTTLSLHTSFHNPQAMDSIGHPVRADIRLDFRTGNPNTNPQQQQSQNLEKVRDLTQIGGFIDFIYQERPQQNQYMPQQPVQWVPGQPSPYACFFARYIITKMKTVSAPTLTQQLIALVTVYTLRQQAAWYPAFKVPYGLGQSKQTDLKDIGALNIFANLMNQPGPYGDKMITKTDTFKEADLGTFLNTAVFPGLIVSMDVEECGSDTWFNGVFAAAAAGDQESIDMIYDACDYLTNGEFSKLYARGKTICFNEQNRIATGYYFADNGEKRDARDLDLLALLNLAGERDPKLVKDWMATHIQTQWPLSQRLDARLNITRELMQGFEQTGWASRVTFDNDWLDALTQAFGACGVSIREVSPFLGATNFDTPQYQFAQQAVGTYHQYNTFNRGGYAPTGGGAAGRVGRW
jgi:hypothetical protein